MQETAQQYTQRMLKNTEGKDPLKIQRASAGKLASLIRGKSKKQLTRRPAPDKWSVAEILAHLADAEIVVSWRLRQVLCSNGASLQPFDQNVWASTLDYAHRDPKQSLETYRVLREGNHALLKKIPSSLWDNYGMHQERGQESVSHIVRMLAGHDVNHIGQIEKILNAK